MKRSRVGRAAAGPTDTRRTRRPGATARQRSAGPARWAGAVLALGLAAWSGGCQQPPGRQSVGTPALIDPTKVETRDDITQIVQYWKPVPWLYDSDRRPVGFQVTVYFWSGAMDRGAFVPGRILVWLYELEPTADGLRQRKLAYGWELSEQESRLYRVRKRSIQGYYYGFPLLWGPEVDVVGKEIEIVFGYERLDGRLLTTPGHRLRVPVPPGYRPPTAATPSAPRPAVPPADPGNQPATQPPPPSPTDVPLSPSRGP